MGRMSKWNSPQLRIGRFPNLLQCDDIARKIINSVVEDEPTSNSRWSWREAIRGIMSILRKCS